MNVGFFSSNRQDGVDNIYKAIPVCGVDVNVIVRNAKTQKPLTNAKVAILDEKLNVIESRVTDANGKLLYNVDCDRAYALQASADGYVRGSFTVTKARGGKVDIAADLTPIDNIIVNGVVVLSDIYFEYDKSNITQEGAAELDKLVEAMRSNATMTLMVKAHTDSRGSDEYNLNLSDNRALATVQYVLSKGIDKSRISGKGYGESEPKVKCGDNCTEEQHAQNRRIEFIVVKK